MATIDTSELSGPALVTIAYLIVYYLFVRCMIDIPAPQRSARALTQLLLSCHDTRSCALSLDDCCRYAMLLMLSMFSLRGRRRKARRCASVAQCVAAAAPTPVDAPTFDEVERQRGTPPRRSAWAAALTRNENTAAV